MKNTLMKLILLTTFCFGFWVNAQSNKETLQLNDFSMGVLPNGMHYYLKNLQEPQTKTYLNLFVHAGHQQELEGQLNFPHAIEHLAFKPTKNFPKSIKEHGLLQGLGMAERDRSATTGFRFTRYFFNAPVHHQKALDTGLLWLKDIMNGLIINDVNVNQERGSLRQEFIYAGEGNFAYTFAEKRLESRIFPCRLSMDNFFEHNQNFDAQALADFYKDWYRPEHTAVAVIGNIPDMKATAQQLQDIFGTIPNPKQPKKEKHCENLYFNQDRQFVKEAWSEKNKQGASPQIEYRLYYRQPDIAQAIGTAEGYQEYVALQLFFKGLQKRLDVTMEDLSIKIGIRNVYKYEGAPLSNLLKIVTDEAYQKETMETVFSRIRQFKEFGLLPEEWEELKQAYLSQQLPGNDAQYWFRELQNHFVYGEALYPEKQEKLYHWLEGLSLKKFNQMSKGYLNPFPDDIGILAPSGSKALELTEQSVHTYIKAGWKQALGRYEKPKKLKHIMSEDQVNKLQPGTIKEVNNSPSEPREFILENGLKLVLKNYVPTTGVYDQQLLLHGFSKNGTSCFPPEDYHSALNAPALVEHSGVGDYTHKQLRGFMEDYTIGGLSSYIDYKETGIKVNCTPASLEAMLQLVYLHITQPNIQKKKFEQLRAQKYKSYQTNPGAYLREDFSNTIREFENDSTHPPIMGYRYLNGKEALESIEQTDIQRAGEIYRQLFLKPHDFTFILSGNFEIAEALPLLNKYLGNLPVDSQPLNCRDSYSGKDFILGPKYHQMVPQSKGMKNLQYALKYVLPIEKMPTWQERIEIALLGEVTNLKLKKLRYEDGFSVYNFGASGIYQPDLQQLQVNFDISCQPNEYHAIREKCLLLIEELKTREITSEVFKQAIGNLKRRYDSVRIKLHRPMQEALYLHYRYEAPLPDLEDYESYLNELKTEKLVVLAQKIFKEKGRYEYVLSHKPIVDNK